MNKETITNNGLGRRFMPDELGPAEAAIQQQIKRQDSVFLIVYRNKNGVVKTYEIGRPDLSASFGNRAEGRSNLGFKAYCYGREAVRSFRHEGIISLTKV
jgi:hypothetical protein